MGLSLFPAVSPQDSGKSLAAEYILHGDHKFRPERALKLSAVGRSMDDFANEFGEQYLGGPENGALLVNALKCAPGSRICEKSRWQITRILFATDDHTSFNEKNLFFLGKHTLVENLPIPFRRPPLLVIDDFKVD